MKVQSRINELTLATILQGFHNVGIYPTSMSQMICFALQEFSNMQKERVVDIDEAQRVLRKLDRSFAPARADAVLGHLRLKEEKGGDTIG